MQLIESTDGRLRPLVGNVKGQVLVLDWRRLKRRFQMPRFQLIKATGGFGCEDGSPGKIFGASVCDGEDGAYRRNHFIGLATNPLIEAAMADTTPVQGLDLSLREYLLVDPETRRVEAFRRNSQDEWVLADMSDDDALALPCLDVRIPMAQVFDRL